MGILRTPTKREQTKLINHFSTLVIHFRLSLNPPHA
jgi:hypothetical protein